MKKIIILAISLLFLNCSKDTSVNSSSFNVIPILGKWQYVEKLDYYPPGPYLITNGPIINLKADFTFTSNELPNYTNGTYTVSTDSIISLKYISANNSIISLKKVSSFSANELILDNDYTGSGACTEGCAERYEKFTTP